MIHDDFANGDGPAKQLARYRRVYEAALGAVVVIDEAGRITGFNPAAERTFGYSKPAVMGRDAAELLIPERHRERHRDGLRDLVATGERSSLGRRLDVRAMRRDGSEFPAELVLGQIDEDPLRFTAFVRDVTDERAREQALLDLANDNAAILNAAGDGIYRTDQQGRITYANPAAATILGYRGVEDLIGEPAHALCHHSHEDGTAYPIADCPIATARTSGEIRHLTDEVFWRADGTSFAVDYTCAPIREAGEIVGAVCVFADITEERERERALRERLRWTERIHVAQRTGGFELHAQPIVPLAGGAEPIFELLIRMRSDEGGEHLLAPGQFLPQLQHHGLMLEIDRWVVGEALREASERRVSFNLSADAVSDRDFAAWMLNEIDRSDAPLHNLVVEITETAALRDADLAAAFTRDLSYRGCEIALDDFGTGYGTFRELKLPVTYLKIDREFVSSLTASAHDRQIVSSIVALASSLGMQTVGEGVEDAATLAALEGLGVDFAQGFHLGRPAAPVRSAAPEVAAA